VTGVLTRVAAAAVLLLPVLAGCTVVADLGDPKRLVTGSEDGGGSTIGDGAIVGDAAGSPLLPKAIAVGGTHACAIVQGLSGQSAGEVRCWGANAQGELGQNPSSVPESALPLPVLDLSDAASLALSTGYSCATTVAGDFMCWGELAGESADGVHRQNPTPAYEPSYVELVQAPFQQIAAASVGPAGGAVLDPQALVCWGSARFQERDAGSSEADAGATLGLFSKPAVGRAHACAITQDSSDVECWGDNTHGQCAVPPQGESFLLYPTYVGLSAMNVTITAVAAGSDFSCALTSDGAVYCWGANDRGQLGNPSAIGDQSTPTQVELPGITARELALGNNHGCVATGGYAVHCWGDNSAGQLGDVGDGGSFQATPVLVQHQGSSGPTQLDNVQDIAAGGDTTCATLATSTFVWCWGANDSGQAGQPPSTMSFVRYAMPLSL
jgi:alpha-tubulin suppressor-like RCC1 family protein